MSAPRPSTRRSPGPSSAPSLRARRWRPAGSDANAGRAGARSRQAGVVGTVDDVTSRPSVAWAEVTIDCRDPEALAEFWSRLLGVEVGERPLPGWARVGPT